MRKISGNADIQFAVADDMTGSHDSRQRPVVTTASRAWLRYGDGKRARSMREINFTIKGRQRASRQLNVDLERDAHAFRTPGTTGFISRRSVPTPSVKHRRQESAARTGAFQGGVHGDILQANQDNVVPTTDGLDNVRRAFDLTAGPHAIEISTTPDTLAMRPSRCA